MPDTNSKPTADANKPVPADTPDRGVQAADAAIAVEQNDAVAPKQDLEKAETAGREGGTR